jgi:3-oxoacyl-(acyl-carrier-protein) synthase
MLKYMSGAAVLGCVAAREALAEAAVKERFPSDRVGLYAGTGLAAASVDEVHEMVAQSIGDDGRLSCDLLGKRGLSATNPLLSFKILANMPPCLISILEGIRGPNLIFTPWEGQTAAAILEAWQAVSSGKADCALAGAADTAAHPSTFVYLRQAGLLRQEEFPASAAAYLVFERADAAVKAQRRIHARIIDARLFPAKEGIVDPLSARMGRTFAAAPAILCGLACLSKQSKISISGVDAQTFEMEFAPA